MNFNAYCSNKPRGDSGPSQGGPFLFFFQAYLIRAGQWIVTGGEGIEGTPALLKAITL